MVDERVDNGERRIVMLLIIEASQMAFPDLEVVVHYFKNMEYEVVLTGLLASGNIIRPMARIIDNVDDTALYENANVDCVMKCYMDLMNERDASPEATHIISNRGQDLAVAILLGTEFTWGFDLI